MGEGFGTATDCLGFEGSFLDVHEVRGDHAGQQVVELARLGRFGFEAQVQDGLGWVVMAAGR